MAETFYQGLGKTKRIGALGPTTRTDGTILLVSEIAHYLRFIAYNGGPPSPPQTVQLIEDAATSAYDGEFDEDIDIDSQAAGTYTYWYRTVDTQGRESPDSSKMTLEILPPLADPSPPTGLYLL